MPALAARGCAGGRGAALCAAIVAATLVTPLWPVAAAEAEPPNLVANGDFSQTTGGHPDHWTAAGDAQSVVQTLRVVRDADGRPHAELACTRFERRGPASHAMLAQVGQIRLVKGRTYEFSCRMKAEGLRGRSVSVALQDTQTWTNAGLQADLAVGPSWKTYRQVFRASRDVGQSGRLQIWFCETGTLCVADVRVCECREQDVEFTDVVPPAGGKNLVPNGSFEAGAAGWSSLGIRAGWGAPDRLHGQTAAGGTHGGTLLRIPLGGGRTPVLYFDYYEPVVRPQRRSLAANLGWIRVEKGAAYTLSCDMRASRQGVSAVIGARARSPAGPVRDYQRTIPLTTKWQRCAITFKPDHPYVFVFAGPDAGDDEPVEVDLDAVQLERGEQATPFEPRATVEWTFEPASPGGVFVEGQPAAIVLTAANHGRTRTRVAAQFAATDFEDKAVALAPISFEVEGSTVAKNRIGVPADWKGYYRVCVEVDAGGRTEQKMVRLALVPRRSADDSVLGINHAFASEPLIRLASLAGVTWYRDWSLKWQHVEPARGEFHWEVADVQLDRVLRLGARVLPLLPPFPSADWSSEAPATLPTQGYPGVRLKQAWAPRDTADLAAFVGAAAARYKDRIRVWEFLNEPIYTDYALPADRTNRYGGKKYEPADYVSLLKVAADAIRRADPGCRIIGGIGSGPTQLTREVIEAGCLKHIDIFNLHIYPGSRRPEAYADEMDSLLAIMDRAGGRKPVWITEFAYYGADNLPRRPFIPAPHSWAEGRLLESERQCADFTVRMLAVMMARGVEKVFLHSGASGEVNDPQFECPLLDYGGAARKLLPAVAVFTELLGREPHAAGHRRLAQSGHAVAFETGRRSVVVVWHEDDEAGPPLDASALAEVSWLDPMGRPAPTARARLSTSPAYLVGPAGKAKIILDALRIKDEN